VRELAPFVLLVCACGAAAVREPDGIRAPGGASGPVTATSAPPPVDSAAETQAAFEALAARASSVAPGMREIARKESGTETVELTRAGDRDACVRVAFEASAPVAVKLVDQSGNVLAATDGPVSGGVLAERGPVCVRKGDVVRGVAEGTGARVRWMAWEPAGR